MSQSWATERSRVIGVRCTGLLIWPSSRSSRTRRSAWGSSIVERPPAASRSKATNAAGVALARRATRDAAGCRRCCKGVEVQAARPGDDDFAIDDAAVPFGLEQEAFLLRKLVRNLGKHGLDGRSGPAGRHYFTQTLPASRPLSTMEKQPGPALVARQRPSTSAPGAAAGPW